MYDTRQINCFLDTSSVINTPKNQFLPVIKHVLYSISDILAESTFSHCHYVLCDYMRNIPYSCRKISQPGIRKGNTLVLRKEKKKIKVSVLLPNYIIFLNLLPYNTHTQMHKCTRKLEPSFRFLREGLS